MKKSLGKVFKLVRESKGLSQREVAADVISLAQLSRFERGINSLTVDAFYACLENMNVPLDEFQSVYSNYTQAKNIQLSTELSEAYWGKNILKIRQLLQECLKVEETFPKQKFYKLNTIVVRAVLFDCDCRETVSKKDIQYLMDYLFSVEEWGHYELWVFTNSVSLLTVSSLELFTSEMINRTQFYQNIPGNRKLILQMLLKVISVCIEKEHLQVALKFLNYIGHFRIPESDLYEILLIKYYRGFYAYRTGNQTGLEEMKKCVGMLTTLECYGTVQQMTEQIRNLEG